MNKEYIYIDGKVIVEDENKQKIIMEYNDNINKVLAQENLVETIKIKQRKLEEALKKQEHKVPNWELLLLSLFFISLPVITTLGIYALFTYWGFTLEDLAVQTIFGPSYVPIITGTMAAVVEYPIAIPVIIGILIKNKRITKNEKSILARLSYLKQNLEKEKQELKRLKSEYITTTEKAEIKEVNDTELLNNLRSELDFYYNLGYNVKKYMKYYEKGKLQQKLEKNHTNSEIKQAVEYIESQKNLVLQSNQTKKY